MNLGKIQNNIEPCQLPKNSQVQRIGEARPFGDLK